MRTALILLLALFGTRAQAFEGEVHEAITRRVLTSLSFRASAIDAIVDGNLRTDKDEYFDPAAHFDDEAFESGSKRLREKIDAAVNAVLACDRSAALENIGRALHSTQDFFSHSNFVERGDDIEALDLLHMTNPAPGTECKPPLFKGPLTTGYWPDDKRPAPNNCIHAELNKDAPLSEPRYVRARELAAYESRKIVQLVEQRLREGFPKLGEADAVVDYLRFGPIALEGTQLTCPLRPSDTPPCFTARPAVLENTSLQRTLQDLSGR